MIVIAICQPKFLPWLGFIEMADRADVFVMHDDVQFNKRERFHRNKLASKNGQEWTATVPLVKAAHTSPINQMRICKDQSWETKFLASLERDYSKAPFYSEFITDYAKAISAPHTLLVDLIYNSNQVLFDFLGIDCEIQIASNTKITADRDAKLIELCKCFDADVYLANNGSKSYIKPDLFINEKIGFVFQDYLHPEYSRGLGIKRSFLSVLDLIFWHGRDSLHIIRSGRPKNWKESIKWR